MGTVIDVVLVSCVFAMSIVMAGVAGAIVSGRRSRRSALGEEQVTNQKEDCRV